MTLFLEIFKKFGQLIFWTITVVVIPATVSFTVLRYDISAAVEKTEENKADIKAVDKKVDNIAANIDEKMDKVISDLGVIKGELRRIR